MTLLHNSFFLFLIGMLILSFGVLFWACDQPEEDDDSPTGIGADDDDSDDDDPNIPEGIPVPVTIDSAFEDGILDDLFLGFTIDTAQFVYNRVDFSENDHYKGADLPDLEDPRLINMVKEAGPVWLRIGGTMADGVYFCPNEGHCELPEEYADAFRDIVDFEPSYISHEDIRRVADFAEATNSKVIYCLNFGPGPRDPDTCAWTTENSRQLIEYARSLPNGDRFVIWEGGNEVNSFLFNFKMPPGYGPERYAADLRILRYMLDEVHQDGLIAGPATYFFPFRAVGDIGFFTQKAMEFSDETIDFLTWHLYATQSDSCGSTIFHQPYPATAENLFDETIISTSRYYARYIKENAGELPVYLGETASAQCGGQQGVSDTVLDALWWADWIGIMAQEGSSSFIRQTLMGFDYGTIDPDTYHPHPTFLATTMFNRLVSRARLKTSSERTMIKAHGFCSGAKENAMTIVLANPSLDKLVANISVMGNTMIEASQWTIASADGLSGTTATIDGEKTDQFGIIPYPEGSPVVIDGQMAFAEVLPESLVFVQVILENPAAGCPAD